MKLTNEQLRGMIKAMAFKPVPYESPRAEIMAQLSQLSEVISATAKDSELKAFVSAVRFIVQSDGCLTMLEMGRFLSLWKVIRGRYAETQGWFLSPVYDLLFVARIDDLKQLLGCIGMPTAKHRDSRHVWKDWEGCALAIAQRSKRVRDSGDDETANALADMSSMLSYIRMVSDSLCASDLIRIWGVFEYAYKLYGRANGWEAL